MTDVNELDEGQLKVLEKIEKLMRLAAKNPSPEEAAAAMGKAQELLVAYNLSAELIGGGQSSDAVREQAMVLGGMYQWQRELWFAIAELNFCMYWTQQKYTERNTRERGWDGQWIYGKVPYMRYQHVVIGKRVNARLTLTMGQYLGDAIERLVKERYPQNSQRFMKDAVGFREGIADELYWRIKEKRQKLIAEEEDRRMRTAQDAGVSTSNALTIGSLAEQERDANNDFIHGEGWSARQRAERAERAEQRRIAEEKYTRWAAENPEEAAKAEKEAAKERRGRRYGGGRSRSPTAAEKRQQSSAYWQGRDKGKEIGLDPQTDNKRKETKAIR